MAGRWGVFLAERFPPGRHLALIACFFAANALAARQATGLSLPGALPLVLGGTAIFMVFLHLRIFDEIKDYATDLSVHPDRPLPRGLVSMAEARMAAFGLMALELALGLAIGVEAFLALLGTCLYSLVMYREFFCRQWLRPRLATYALSHTVNACWLGLSAFSVVTGLHFWQLPSPFLRFLVADWLVFNVFEFGRKTFGGDEEQPGVDSYSRRFGPAGAAAVVAAMAGAAALLPFVPAGGLVLSPAAGWGLALLLTAICTAGARYALSPSAGQGRLFRGACTLFILGYNLLVALGLW
jgi:4-hydroxybenzoate polyprenyltransferase